MCRTVNTIFNFIKLKKKNYFGCVLAMRRSTELGEPFGALGDVRVPKQNGLRTESLLQTSNGSERDGGDRR